MSHPGKVRALLATLRIANAPSVVSNVYLCYVLGWLKTEPHYWEPGSMEWHRAAMACLAGLLLYFSGNLANDWFDRKWDAEKRPERALSSGLFHPTSYLVCTILLAVAGITLAFFLHPLCGITAVVIALLVATYTYFHKKAMWAVIPMGLCRVGLYFLGYFASWVTFAEWRAFAAEGFDVPSMVLGSLRAPGILAVGLFCYIVGLSLSARYEGMEDAPKGPKVISLALLILPLAAMSSSFMGYNSLVLAGIIGMLPFAVWLTFCLTYFKKPIPRYVSALLAGIPLVDLIAAVPLVRELDLAKYPPGFLFLPHLVAMLVIPVAAFLIGRLLQRLAPAT